MIDRYRTDPEYRSFVDWIARTIAEDPKANAAWDRLDEEGREIASQAIIDELKRLERES